LYDINPVDLLLAFGDFGLPSQRAMKVYMTSSSSSWRCFAAFFSNALFLFFFFFGRATRKIAEQNEEKGIALLVSFA